LKPGKIIYFAKDGAAYFDSIATLNISGVGIDWKTSLIQAAKVLPHFCIQGNMDPAILLTTPEAVTAEACKIMLSGQRVRSHIFNLGHGIMPKTPVENVLALVRFVQGQQ
jgi:uroporphyrinogen decarboxylase